MIGVTGATGQLGTLILAELLKRTDARQIVGVVRSPEKAGDLAKKGITLRKGDYGDYDSLAQAFTGMDTLMFVSNSNVPNRETEHKNVVNAAKSAGVKHVVYTSVTGTEANNFLTAGHLLTEKDIQQSGLTYTILRDNLYMDAYGVEVKIAIQNGVYRSPIGEAGAGFVLRADVARAAAAVLTSSGHEGKIYAMTGPSRVTPADFAAAASKISGKPITYQKISWEELASDYRGRGMDEQMVSISVFLERLIGEGVFAQVSDDIQRLTGQPPQDFLSFMRKAVK